MRLTQVLGTGLALRMADALSLFPGCVSFWKRELKAMKTLKQILFTLVAVVGLSLAVSAQSGGQQRPPKPKPEIPAKPKPPKDEKPKKPGMSYFVALPPESGYSE